MVKRKVIQRLGIIISEVSIQSSLRFLCQVGAISSVHGNMTLMLQFHRLSPHQLWHLIHAKIQFWYVICNFYNPHAMLHFILTCDVIVVLDMQSTSEPTFHCVWSQMYPVISAHGDKKSYEINIILYVHVNIVDIVYTISVYMYIQKYNVYFIWFLVLIVFSVCV